MVNETFSIGDNIKGKVENDKLYLEIDLTKDLGLSKSGKSSNIATTRGNQTVPNTNIKLGLNMYKPAR